MLFSLGEGVGAAGVEVSGPLHRSPPQATLPKEAAPQKIIVL